MRQEIEDDFTMTKKLVEHITSGGSSKLYYRILSMRLVCIQQGPTTPNTPTVLCQDFWPCFKSYVPRERIFYLYLIFNEMVLCEVYNTGQGPLLQKKKKTKQTNRKAKIERTLVSLSRRNFFNTGNSSHMIIEKTRKVESALAFQEQVAKL